MIPWRPIVELPDALRDGREVLLWSDGTAEVCTWWTHEGGHWTTSEGVVKSPTHFTEINPPA